MVVEEMVLDALLMVGGFIGVFVLLIIAVGVIALLNRSVQDFSRIPKANARGNIEGQDSTFALFIYPGNEEMARKVIQLQEEVQAHAGGEGQPFYCNAYTGWRRKVYDISYKRTLKSIRRQVSWEAQESKRAAEYNPEEALFQNLKSRRAKMKA